MAAMEESEDSGMQEPVQPSEMRQDELIEKLVPDPATPPDVIMLVGFRGESTRPGYMRFYLTPLLNEFVEISVKDVLHSQPAPPALNPLGGTLLWVRREANLLHTRTTTQQMQGQFLQGSITTGFLPKTGIESLFERPYPFTTNWCEPATIFDICPPSIFDICPPSIFIMCSGDT